MFYCDACAAKCGYPTDFYISRSRGPCEICGTLATCYDVPSSKLPEPRQQEESNQPAPNKRKPKRSRRSTKRTASAVR